MLKISASIVASFLLSCASAFGCPCSEITVPNPAPTNLNYADGVKFTKTPQYRKMFAEAITSAKKACMDYLAKHPGETNLAIVSDIDETVLDNREHFQSDPERDWDQFDTWLRESRAPVLKPTFDFLNWARAKGFAIFFITGRPESDRKPTIINLVRDKISYDGLYLREHHGGPPAEEYKSAVRKNIENMGFKIVVNIGDQYSDLAGGYSIDCEKLPNKMYFIQ